MPCDRFLLLCEDRAQERFVRRWLASRGLRSQRQLRVAIAPAEKGAAEAYVRKQYPVVVTEFRRNANHQLGLGQLVMVDADHFPVVERLGQLESALTDQGMPRRQAHERICLLVPKRHIETWLKYLSGTLVDEDMDVKRRLPAVSDAELAAAAGAFDPRRRSVDCLPSLLATQTETARVGL